MDPAVLREDMVDGLERAFGGRRLDERVDVAMRTVPRHEFVDDRAYDNRDDEHAGTRVLAPVTVARLLDALAAEPGEQVLVVGAGVGYTSAVLAEIAGERNVHAVDIARRVVVEARRNLRSAGYDAVLVDRRDGANGLPEYAPFDRILVEAAAVRPPRALLDQLADAGRLVMPKGGPKQTLVAIEAQTAAGSSSDRPPAFDVVETFGPVAFDPMLVEGEQADGVARNRTEREDREYAEMGWHARTGWEYDWVDWDDHL
ncbi:protein-L-isoaspartate O-methyltransferase family protein [Halegenticoccus tardaugens]|uniref:protein-L-isoaspartate O-methyltransferase family protein n=1 Tax=Halegenticoccus tardaugens TaxID=2071624 RepID=UPI00100BCFED|nr:protein-L-isoaspartate O-methyltransferase [Halegenticoccus tardaugens]